MSTIIESVTISSLLEKRLVLSNSQWAAKLDSRFDGWTKLRIGMRFAFSDSGVAVPADARFFFGLLSNPSSGMANGPLGNSTSHYLGYRSSRTATWPRFTTPIVYYSSGTGSPQNDLVKRVGSTDTVTPITNFGMRQVSAAEDSIRLAFVLEITKGSPNFTVNSIPVISTPGLATADLALTEFKEAMNAPTMTGCETILEGYTGLSLSQISAAIAVNEGTNGNLNAVCLGWNLINPLPNISEVLAAKMA